MPRQRLSKPWFHEASGYWCTSIDRRRIYLDRDYRVACRKLRGIRAEQKRNEQAGQSAVDMYFADLADDFLDDIKSRKSEDTHKSYRYRLLRAMQILGTNLRVGDVKKIHLAKIEGALFKNYSPTTIKDTIATVQTVFSWAVRHDLLDDNPLAGYEKPKARIRSRTIEPAEFQALLRHSDVAFRRVLIALRMTGCRTVEVRSLIWEWVDLNKGFWILPKHKTITRQKQPKPRIVPLPPPVLSLCAWLSQSPHQQSDHVFLNSRGKPYTKDCFCRKMSRIRERAGIQIKAGERLVLYSARHTFATEAAGRITDIELAELLGQTDTRTTQRYVHFNAPRLRDIQRRAQGRQA